MHIVPLSRFSIREARASDIPLMKDFIFAHGSNPWNFLPEAEVMQHLDAIYSGYTCGLLAFDGTQLAGMVTFTMDNPLRAYEPPGALPSDSGYIAEGVVAKEYAGNGLGTYLLMQACALLRASGKQRVYAKRHEQNRASAGALRKAGFIEIATFDDFETRLTGSRRTTVCKLDLSIQNFSR